MNGARKKNAIGQHRTAERRRAQTEVCATEIQLVRGGLGWLSRLNADEAAVTAPIQKFYVAGDERE